MSENQVDGGSDNGTATNVNGGASGTQGVQQPSFDAKTAQSILDAVNTLSKRVDGLQSVKDRQATELTGLKGKIAEYEKLKEKLGPEGALDQMELKQTLAEIKAQLSGSASAQTTDNSASGAVNAAQAFAKAGFTDEELKDPRIGEALTKSYQSNEMAELAAYRIRQQLASNPSPNPAQGAALQGGKPKPADQALADEYLTEYQAALTSGDRNHAMSVRKKYRELGVNIDAVKWQVT